MEREETIDLLKLGAYLLSKWRLLFIYMMVFAVLGGAYGYISSYKNAEAVKAELEKPKDKMSYAQYEEGLTKTEIEEVKAAVDDYKRYKKIYEEDKTYYDSSMKMRLDAKAVPTYQVSYLVRGNTKKEEIIKICKNTLIDDGLCQSIIGKTGWTAEAGYVKELISFNNYDETREIKITGEDTDFTESVERSKGEQNSEVLSIKITADSKENCVSIKEAIDDRLSVIAEDIKETMGQFQITEVADRFALETDQTLLMEQQLFVEEMNRIGAQMRELKGALSEGQKKYFLVLTDETFQIEEQKEGMDASVLIPEVRIINGKYVLLGAFLGLVIIGMYLTAKFVLSGQMHMEEVITDGTKSPVLGTFATDKQGKGLAGKIDCWLNHCFKRKAFVYSNEEKLDMICASVRIAIEKNQLQKIHLCSAAHTEETKTLLAALYRRFQKMGITFTTGNSVVWNPDSLEKLAEANGVVFVEQMGVSLVKDIYIEANLSRKNNVQIIGFVVID